MRAEASHVIKHEELQVWRHLRERETSGQLRIKIGGGVELEEQRDWRNKVTATNVACSHSVATATDVVCYKVEKFEGRANRLC